MRHEEGGLDPVSRHRTHRRITVIGRKSLAHEFHAISFAGLGRQQHKVT